MEVGGVRRMKWKVRSGRMVMRQGIGVDGWYWEVRALNSWDIVVLGWLVSGRWTDDGAEELKEVQAGVVTLQKSMDFTPLLPSAGPTGGEGEAWPAPTMSLTICSLAKGFRAMSCG